MTWTFRTLAALAAVLMTAFPAWADSKNGVYFSLSPTLVSPTQNPTKLDLVKISRTTLTEPTIAGQNAKFKMKVGLGIAGEIGYKWRTNLRTGLEAGYRNTDIDQVQSATGTAVADGEFETSTIFFNVAYDFDNEDGPAPYIFGGLGAAYQELTLRSVNNVSLSKREDDVNFAFQAGAGLYKPINEFIDAGLGYRFVWSNGQKFGFVSTEMGIHQIELTFRFY